MAAAAEAVKTGPLARVKEEFGGKDKLVDKIVGVLESDESKDELRKKLLGVSNTKLIRLFSVATKTKQAGGHDKLVAATAERLKRTKDKDFVTKLDEYSNARLLDVMDAAEGRSAAAVSQVDGSKPPVARAARPAKPVVAKPAAKAAKPEKSAKAKKSAAAVKSARAKKAGKR